MAITYQNQNGRKNSRGDRLWNIDVFLDGKRVGEIRSVAAGYHYKPLSGKAGAVLPTLAEVKRSLEEE